MRDFFISYNRSDRTWAEWIAWQLESEGYFVVVQAWDIRPGSNFVVAMQRGVEGAECTIAVLSRAYARSRKGAGARRRGCRRAPRACLPLVVPGSTSWDTPSASRGSGSRSLRSHASMNAAPGFKSRNRAAPGSGSTFDDGAGGCGAGWARMPSGAYS